MLKYDSTISYQVENRTFKLYILYDKNSIGTFFGCYKEPFKDITDNDLLFLKYDYNIKWDIVKTLKDKILNKSSIDTNPYVCLVTKENKYPHMLKILSTPVNLSKYLTCAQASVIMKQEKLYKYE